MTFSVDVSELTALATDLGKSTVRVGAKAAAAVRKATLATARDAKAGIHNVTGRTEETFSTEFTGDGRSTKMTGATGPTTFWGKYAEEGTSRMGPRPYLAPAMDKNTEPFVKSMGDIAKEILQ